MFDIKKTFNQFLCSLGIQSLDIQSTLSESFEIQDNFLKHDNPFEELRREIKFFFQSSEIQWLKSFVRTHPAGFRVAYEPRFVNNLYFDRKDLSSFYDTVNGVSRRAKVRLRWYGGLTDEVQAVLEFKIKKNHTQWKIRSKINKKIKLSEMSWQQIVNEIKRDLQVQDKLIFFRLCAQDY